MKTALVGGAGGFIGHHMVKRLKAEGYWVRGVDLKYAEFEKTSADEFHIADLREPRAWVFVTPQVDVFDEVYQFAANMGGMGFLGDAGNDAQTLRDNALINLRTVDACSSSLILGKKPKVFFASSACVYPPVMPPLGYRAVYTTDGGFFQENRRGFLESDAYPADPDLNYGWEKLFSERLYQAYAHKHGFEVRIGRFHNVYGPLGTWQGGREKAPAALCRKVAELTSGGELEIWGDGNQRRSFMYIDDAIEGVRRLMESHWKLPINLGSSEMVSVNELAATIGNIAGKAFKTRHIEGPVGVRGRNSDNTLIQEKLNWQPSISLRDGLEKTYKWIEQQVRDAQNQQISPVAPQLARTVAAG